jgi:hypothetical protein
MIFGDGILFLPSDFLPSFLCLNAGYVKSEGGSESKTLQMKNIFSNNTLAEHAGLEPLETYSVFVF